MKQKSNRNRERHSEAWVPKLPQFHNEKIGYKIGRKRTGPLILVYYLAAKHWRFTTGCPESFQRAARKLAFPKCYNLTREGFTDKFHHSKPEVSESTQQYMTRIKSYLEK